MIVRREIAFPSGESTCSAWYLPASSEVLERSNGRPCVVMAHGFSGTRDGGLLPYAEGFAAAGMDVLLFDYRGFGESTGTPRQLVSYRRQRADYKAAVAAARATNGVDPERIVLWGTSYSGGHVLAVGAKDSRVAAVVSMTPSVDGLATLIHIVRTSGIKAVLRLAAEGLRDLLHAVGRRPPRMLKAVGPVGSGAFMAKDGALEMMESLGSPTWRNEVCAREAVVLAFNRPAALVPTLQAPVLVQAGDRDTVVPARAALRAAARVGGGVEARRYPVDHFDVYAGAWQRRFLQDQVDFLLHHLNDGDSSGTVARKRPRRVRVHRSEDCKES
jgi:pimeloyl-ACP methyl ester carboxylesterase